MVQNNGIVDIQKKEAALLEDMACGSLRYNLYEYCADYYWEKYRGVFAVDNETAADILQDTFVVLLKNIKSRKIYVEHGVVIGKDGLPLKGSILTYFMSVSRYKYLEWKRKTADHIVTETQLGHDVGGDDKDIANDEPSDSGSKIKIDIIADALSALSSQCREILTKFYYDEKPLEDILNELPGYSSYKALKTGKYKCMEKLRKVANERYSHIMM